METNKQPKFIWCLAQLDTCIAAQRELFNRRTFFWALSLLTTVVVSLTMWSIPESMLFMTSLLVVLSFLLLVITSRQYSRWKQALCQFMTVGQDVEVIRIGMDLFRQNEQWSETQYQAVSTLCRSLPIFLESDRY